MVNLRKLIFNKVMDIYCIMMYLLSFNITKNSTELLGYSGEEPQEFWDYDYEIEYDFDGVFDNYYDDGLWDSHDSDSEWLSYVEQNESNEQVF